MRYLFVMSMFLCLLWSTVPVVAEETPWHVRIEPRAKQIRTYTKRYKVLEIENDTLSVDFSIRTFWTVHEIFYKGTRVNQSSGATGTVIHWDGEAIGTGHRGKKRSEELHEVMLTVDGTSHTLFADGAQKVPKDFVASGRQITLLKKSVIGPLRHEAQFDFDMAGKYYIATHRFEVIETITPERFKGYRYVFMQMMPKDMSLWRLFGSDHEPGHGEASRPDPQLDKKKQTKLFDRVPMKALACYSPTNKVGIAYVYPEKYPGVNHYLDRFWKDNKFRGILFEKDSYEVGEKFEYRMRVQPFSAAPDNWQQIATGVVEEH